MTTARYLAIFRQAREAGSAWNLTKTLAQVAAFWFVFLVAIPGGLVALEQALGVPPMNVPVSDTLAWVGFAAASALGLASGTLMALDGGGTPLPFDAPRRLVVRGPYRYVRNPMAIAGLAQGACVALLLDSWFTVGLVVAGFLVWNHLVRPLEEAHLEAMFGESFREYCGRVRCWVPRGRA